MGKRLTNAPVYFTILQVKFNAILNLADFLPKIQDTFRRMNYADYRTDKHFVFELATKEAQDQNLPPVPTQKDRYFFGNADKTYLFILDSNSLTLQSTDYKDFDVFSGEFYKALESIHSIVEFAFIDRIGLRYLDRVMPRTGEALDLYLIPEIAKASRSLNGTLHYTYNEIMAETDGVTVISRFMIQYGGLGFPPDIDITGMNIQSKFTDYVGLSAVLDNDGFIERRQEFSVSTFAEQIKQIKKVVKNSFKSVLNPEAFEAWK